MPEEWLRVLAPLQTDWHKEASAEGGINGSLRHCPRSSAFVVIIVAMRLRR
jgi:hypothetical protein